MCYIDGQKNKYSDESNSRSFSIFFFHIVMLPSGLSKIFQQLSSFSTFGSKIVYAVLKQLKSSESQGASCCSAMRDSAHVTEQLTGQPCNFCTGNSTTRDCTGVWFI
jgi:hypothetical protein